MQLLRGARGLGDVCTSGASVADCRVVAGGVGRKALAAEAGTPARTVFPPAANGTAEGPATGGARSRPGGGV